MKGNTILTTVLIILLLVAGFSAYWMWRKLDKQDFAKDLNKQKVVKLEKSIDSLVNLKVDLDNARLKSIDSMKKIKENIKYVPYEKPVYIDLSVDAALDTIADFRLNTRATSKAR